MKKDFAKIWVFRIVPIVIVSSSLFGLFQLKNTFVGGLLAIFFLVCIIVAGFMWMLGNMIEK